ncbi:MAG: GTPase Era, partial [Halarsenatibacteraceae bacterium]
MAFKSGFITIVGRPNVGKSTLVNKLIGEKAAIVSARPQTTRQKIRAILTTDDFQAVFVDTPGVHKIKNKLDEYMLDQIYSSLKNVDLIFFVVDSTSGFGKGDQFIFDQIKDTGSEIILVANKADKVSNKKLIDRLKLYQEKTGLEPVAISATQGKGLDNLERILVEKLPEGPKYYPEDMFTDQLERNLVAELIREPIFDLLRDEIPYGTAVMVEEIKERDDGMIYVRANIFVERSSHKGIIIGKNGKMLKKIGQKAREEIEKLEGGQVFLDLWVKEKKK